jgi:xanthine dehydrogenase molybdopterin-binding subunit B
VPNTSATAASSGADLNGAAVQQARAHAHRGGSRPVAARMLGAKSAAGHPGAIVFVDGQVRAGTPLRAQGRASR